MSEDAAITRPDDYVHEVTRWQALLDTLRIKIPRGQCGASLIGEPPDPTVFCPKCAARSGYSPEEIADINQELMRP